MTAADVKDIIRKILAVDTTGGANIDVINGLCKQIADDGWKLMGEYYGEKRITARRGTHYPLKNPITEWHVVAWWVKGDQKVWYYNNHAFSKKEAVDSVNRLNNMSFE